MNKEEDAHPLMPTLLAMRDANNMTDEWDQPSELFLCNSRKDVSSIFQDLVSQFVVSPGIPLEIVSGGMGVTEAVTAMAGSIEDGIISPPPTPKGFEFRGLILLSEGWALGENAPQKDRDKAARGELQIPEHPARIEVKLWTLVVAEGTWIKPHYRGPGGGPDLFLSTTEGRVPEALRSLFIAITQKD